MWMGDAAFSYYLPAVIPYIESEASAEDDVFVSFLLSVLECRVQDSPEAIRACRADVLHLLHYLKAHWAKFEIGLPGDPFYGDLPEVGARLLAAVEAL